MVYAVIGFGVFAIWGAVAFAVGVRVGFRRGKRTVFVSSPRLPLANSVARMPEERDSQWSEPDWSRSPRREPPGTGS
ncbi:MAG: hypothetical protein ACJ72O_05515 [Marmoricola sp.]